MSKIVTPWSKICNTEPTYWSILPPLGRHFFSTAALHICNTLPCKSCKSAKISVCLPFTRLLPLLQTRGAWRGCAADNSSCLLAFFRAIIYQKTPGEFPALSPGSSVADRFTEVTHRYTHNKRASLYTNTPALSKRAALTFIKPLSERLSKKPSIRLRVTVLF